MDTVDYFKEYFEPELLKLADREIDTGGLITKYALAMAEFNLKMLEVMGEQFKSVVYIYEVGLLRMFPVYIDALIDDPEARSLTKQAFKNKLDSRE